MKVSLIGPVYPYRGGIAHFSTLLARALQERGHKVQLLSFRRQYPGWLYPGISDKDPSQAPLIEQADYPIDPIYPWTWKQAVDQIVTAQPDALVVSWWTTFLAPAFWYLSRKANRNNIPVIFLIHNVIPHETHFWDVWLTRQVLAKGDGFVVLSPQEKERLLSLFPQAMVVLCPHPRYDNLALDRMPKDQAKEKLGIPANTPVVLFFGIVRPYKGLRYLIEGVSHIVKEGINLHLIVAGEFWENRGLYDKLIKKLGISNRVTLENRYIPNEEVGLFFSAADVFVAPYVRGTQSGAVQIALSFDLPIVVTEQLSGGLQTDDPWIKVVPGEDSSALARAICDSIGAYPLNPVKRRENSAESWKRLGDAIETLVKESKDPA